MQNTKTIESRYWRISFIIISALIIIIMPLLSRDYGQSGDEWLQIEYGQDIYNYFFKGDTQALDYSNKSLQYESQQLYGGFFDFPMELLHNWLPSVPILFLRHFFNALLGALLMVFTGLFAFRLTKKWSVGLIALLFIIFSPRIFGESMNNPKDIPFATGFIIGVYFWLAFLQEFPKRNLKNAIGIALGFALAFGVRSAGGLLQVGYFGIMTLLYYFTNKEFRETLKANNNKLFKKGIFILFLAIVGGYTLALLTWPWGLQSPLSHPIESLKEMANRGVTLRVFFEGIFRPNSAQPWYYELKWIIISNPLIVIVSAFLFLVLFNRARKEYGNFVVIFLIFAAFFTPLYMIYQKSSVHDTWRHIFFVYPFWVCMGALGLPLLTSLIKYEKVKSLPIIIAALGLMPAIVWTFKSHPNQYVYFNSLTALDRLILRNKNPEEYGNLKIEGGIKGAHGFYDTDYYQNSALQDAKWIIKNVKPIHGRKVLVASNMLGFDKYFAGDTSWISYYYVRYNDRHQKEWDYYVTYSRYISPEQLQNNLWPPKNAVHTVEVNGVVLSAVLERKSNASIEAYQALQQSDFTTAAQKYAEYIQANPYDENVFMNYGIALASSGQLDAAITALNKATELDPGRIDFYQILAQAYKAKGDMQGAQRAMNQANALIMRDQEGAD